MLQLSTLSKIASSMQAIPGLSEETKKQLAGLIGKQLQKLDLVSREDFEVQRKSLEKTREILTSLEKKVAELEQQLQNKNNQ